MCNRKTWFETKINYEHVVNVIVKCSGITDGATTHEGVLLMIHAHAACLGHFCHQITDHRLSVNLIPFVSDLTFLWVCSPSP